jgi:hypothetical protein
MKRLDEIFDIQYGSQLDLNKCIVCEKPDGFNFVNRSNTNCGVQNRILEIERKKPFDAGLITAAMGGSILASFVQQEPFYTGQNVKVLIPKQEMSTTIKLYYCQCIEHNRFRFTTFGREANYTFDSLLVPDLDDIPEYVKEETLFAYQAKFKQKPTNKSLPLNTDNWKWFSYNKLFSIEKGKRLTKADMTRGTINYIGATDSNNGITAKISNDEHIYKENTITVSYNGSIAEAFYQAEPFWATDDVNVLYPKFTLNQYIAIFLCTLIEKEKYRFNYGRKWDKKMMLESKIKLPAISNDTPDWQYIENYIKALPYADKI